VHLNKTQKRAMLVLVLLLLVFGVGAYFAYFGIAQKNGTNIVLTCSEYELSLISANEYEVKLEKEDGILRIKFPEESRKRNTLFGQRTIVSYELKWSGSEPVSFRLALSYAESSFLEQRAIAIKPQEAIKGRLVYRSPMGNSSTQAIRGDLMISIDRVALELRNGSR
jgi:hypothetical protein